MSEKEEIKREKEAKQKEKLKDKENLNQKGEGAITLIALVITIIVLLILAWVTISALSGDNGILTQAANSKVKNMLAELKENVALKQMEDLENTEPETEVYKSIIDKIDNDESAFEIKGEIIKFDENKFSESEERILKNEIGLGSIQDVTNPYGTAEKEIVDGKVKIKVYTADDETDVKRIELPDGTTKNIEYDTEKIMFIEKDNVPDRYKSLYNKTINSLNKYFKNIKIINSSEVDINDIGDTNIALNMMYYGKSDNHDLIKNLFDRGLNVITNGNDEKNSYIIKDAKSEATNGNFIIKNNNETIDILYKEDSFTTDPRALIHYIDDVDVLVQESVNGTLYDSVGVLRGKDNFWLDCHSYPNSLEWQESFSFFFRNAIYRMLKSRYAEYVVTENGTYTFLVEDLSGNTQEISVEVNEL